MRFWTVSSMHVAVGLALLTWALAGTVASQNARSRAPIESKFPLDDADPESSIPSPEEVARDPVQMGYLMMETTRRAGEALRQGKPAKAAKYYRAVAKAAPERALGFREACAAHKRAGEIAKAVDMCRAALGTNDATPEDRLKFLDVALEKRGTLTPAEIGHIDQAIARLGRELGTGKADKGRRGLAEIKCQVAARLSDPQRLTACTEELRSLNTDRARLLPYVWALAVSRGDLNKAESLKEEAIRARLPAQSVEVMARGLAKAREERDGPLLTAAKRWWPAAVGIVLALGAIVVFQRKRRAASSLRPAA
jgi:tetratricopeptide (TPR) repeat protein